MKHHPCRGEEVSGLATGNGTLRPSSVTVTDSCRSWGSSTGAEEKDGQTKMDVGLDD